MTVGTEQDDKTAAEQAPAMAETPVAAVHPEEAEAAPAPGMAESEAASEGAAPAFVPPDAAKTFPYDLESEVLARAFTTARTPHRWSNQPVDEETFRHLYDLVKLGPTSANSTPGRFVFVRSQEGKEKLARTLTPGNQEGVLTAPVTVIVAYDPSFYDFLPRLYPQAEDARSWFAWNDDFSRETALRNGSLQGGYLILAARLLGLDCWPMSGFDNARVDTLFLDGRGWRSNFLLSLGHAEPVEGPRNPRLIYEECCEVI